MAISLRHVQALQVLLASLLLTGAAGVANAQDAGPVPYDPNKDTAQVPSEKSSGSVFDDIFGFLDKHGSDDSTPGSNTFDGGEGSSGGTSGGGTGGTGSSGSSGHGG